VSSFHEASIGDDALCAEDKSCILIQLFFICEGTRGGISIFKEEDFLTTRNTLW